MTKCSLTAITINGLLLLINDDDDSNTNSHSDKAF